jgi:hypothetical protein
MGRPFGGEVRQFGAANASSRTRTRSTNGAGRYTRNTHPCGQRPSSATWLAVRSGSYQLLERALWLLGNASSAQYGINQARIECGQINWKPGQISPVDERMSSPAGLMRPAWRQFSAIPNRNPTGGRQERGCEKTRRCSHTRWQVAPLIL